VSRRGVAVVVVACVAFIGLPALPSAAVRANGGDRDEYYVSAYEAAKRERESRAIDPAKRLTEYRRSAACLLPPASSLPCPPTDPAEPPLSLRCEDGDPVPPLWGRERGTPDDDFALAGELYVTWSCPEDQLPVVSQDDLRVLKVAPLLVHQQPVEGPMLLNKPVIVYVEPAEQDFHTVLLGTYGVDVHVKPEKYTWDFGDGEKLTTRRAGRPYPAFDVTHMYAETGTRQITLTTTWTATYRLDDDPAHRWRDVPGTATTTDTGIEFEIIEWRTRLVDE